jgi:hypothetical protein
MAAWTGEFQKFKFVGVSLKVPWHENFTLRGFVTLIMLQNEFPYHAYGPPVARNGVRCRTSTW